MVNALRGEQACVMDGATWTFRPSFQAIMEIEERLGGVVPLAQRVAGGDFGLREVAIVLWATALDVPGTPRRSLDAVGEAVVRTGLVDAAAVVRALLTQILTGAAVEAGKPQPPVG